MDQTLSQISKMNDEFKQSYCDAFSQGFSARMDAQLGDGCIKGINDLGSMTIAVFYKGTDYYFMGDYGQGACIIPTAGENAKSQQGAIHTDTLPLDDQIFIYQQLLANNWFKAPKWLKDLL